ncbi:reverse transcriptase [Phytophthora megakarya]|uniref:Reverse transcriptase n=1 Tax=Phytophthora megakarya TaxID=4795 RepID=A0A225VWS1_9STRA|nr:reverse transcriptase [Phytophthora megakarya]
MSESASTGKGRPTIQGESPGNIVATYPFQVVAMNHIPSLPASHKGNTELLIWVDLFTGFVIAKASASRTAQTVAESYEEAVFRRFGASEAIRHDRVPGFMSDFFRAFIKLMGQRQRATLAKRGGAERMVQTITRSIKMYIADNDQRDWVEYAERLTYALNTAHDRTRDETPFFLVHGWDPRSTLEATLAIGNTSHRDVDARRWRMRIHRHYKTARAQALELIREAVDTRTHGRTRPRRNTQYNADPKSACTLIGSSPGTQASLRTCDTARSAPPN